jgi:hypothetical protein
MTDGRAHPARTPVTDYLDAGFVAVVAPAGVAAFLWCFLCFFVVDFDVVDFCVPWALGVAFGEAGLAGVVEPD